MTAARHRLMVSALHNSLCTISDPLCLSHNDFCVSQRRPSRYKRTRLPHFTHQRRSFTSLFLVLDVPYISSFFPPDQELCSLWVFFYDLQHHGSLLLSPYCSLGGWVGDRRTCYSTQQAHCPKHPRFDQEVGGSLCQFPSKLRFTIHLILMPCLFLGCCKRWRPMQSDSSYGLWHSPSWCWRL
jgi:hypothetical protein